VGAIIIADRKTILPEHLDLPTASFTIKKSDEPPQSMALYDISRQHVLDVLEKCNWNQKRATEILKISKATLWRKLKEYDINIKALRQSTYS
jgi:transcriptional regulator of acetoin/glycerol metabolism